MGCDIHLHIEVKLYGNWEHYACPAVQRNYKLFAVMAGVRNYDDTKPIAEPKGLPGDITAITKNRADYDGSDGHSHSWLSAEEIVTLEDRVVEYRHGKDAWFDLEYHVLHCYLLGNSFGGFAKYPNDRPEGVSGVRFVFWFDN